MRSARRPLALVSKSLPLGAYIAKEALFGGGQENIKPWNLATDRALTARMTPSPSKDIHWEPISQWIGASFLAVRAEKYKSINK